MALMHAETCLLMLTGRQLATGAVFFGSTNQVQGYQFLWLPVLTECQALNKAASACQDSSAETNSRYGNSDISK